MQLLRLGRNVTHSTYEIIHGGFEVSWQIFYFFTFLISHLCAKLSTSMETLPIGKREAVEVLHQLHYR